MIKTELTKSVEPYQPILTGQIQEIKNQQREINEIVSGLKSLANRLSTFQERDDVNEDGLLNKPRDLTVTNEISDIISGNNFLIRSLNEISGHLNKYF